MKYIIILALNISILLSNNIFEINSIKNNNIIILDNTPLSDLKVGQSGFVISKYRYLEFINASVYITDITKDYIYVEVIEKNPFKKENLAYIKKDITHEDVIVFNMFENKTFLISPNKSAYLKISSKINQDLLPPYFVATKSGSFGINKRDFIKIAKKFLVGNFYIAFDNKLVNIDAFSLKILSTKHININTSTYEQPFFTFTKEPNVVVKIASFFTNFNYNNYYASLVNSLK